jgi:hypothetical protein
MTSFSSPGPIRATVEVAGAQVRINAADRNDTVVGVEPLDPADNRAVQVVEKTEVDFAGGELSVKMRKAGDRSGTVAITIDLPAGSSLVYSEAYSDLRSVGPLGRTDVNLGSGRIRLDRVDDLRASLAAGELTIDHVAGRADVQAGAAAVKIGEVEGPAKLLGSSAQVRIGNAAADLDLTNSSGGFDVGRAAGNVTAMTGGNAVIRIGCMTSGQAELKSASGNIEVGVDEGSAVRVEAGSTYGSVRNTVPQDCSANTGGLVTIDARTRRGDVIIQPAQR